jgi:hypothetical protein
LLGDFLRKLRLGIPLAADSGEQQYDPDERIAGIAL